MMASIGFPDRVEPQTNDVLALHVLVATEGGPLSVRESHDDQYSPSLCLLERLFQDRVFNAALTST